MGGDLRRKREAMTHTSTTPMPYEAWRITYQSSEAAARAAYARVQELEFARAIAAACSCNINMASQAQRVPLSRKDAEELVHDCDYNPHLVLRTMERRFGITQAKQG